MTQPSARIIRPCTAVWLVLMLLSLVTYSLGGTDLSGKMLTLLVLGIAVVKAQLVADHFMGLRQVAGFWRPLISVYLLILALGIGLAFAVR